MEVHAACWDTVSGKRPTQRKVELKKILLAERAMVRHPGIAQGTAEWTEVPTN
jgi:hypothetical protein